MSTGSQFLQVSLTGMVNVLLHSQAITSKVRCGSRWDIWPHSSIPLLARLLDNNAPLSDCDLGGPISRATYYLGRDLITDAATAGAIPWTCIQNPGYALFIPSGCLVFGSPVRSGLLTPRAIDRNRNRSFLFWILKKTGPN